MGLLTAPMSVEFDAASLRRFAALANAAPVMAAFYTSAMNACVNKVATEAKNLAPVGETAGGTLRRGIRGYTLSPWEGRAGVLDAVPYARRREFGFDDQTDALGRYFPLDPKDDFKREHMHYLQRGFEASKPFIQQAYASATALGIRRILV